MQTKSGTTGGPDFGIALLSPEEHPRHDFLLTEPAQILWEPNHLKLLDDTERNGFLWKTSEPEFEPAKPLMEYAARQYRRAAQAYAPAADAASGKAYNRVG